MMNRLPLLFTALLIGSAIAEPTDSAAPVNELRDVIRARSEGAFIDESTALRQEQTKAAADTGFNMELRPGISEDDADVALRIYLPNQWRRNALREQLSLAAESEQLRIDALEWNAVSTLYRDFCRYRQLSKQLALYEKERLFVEPYLARADQSVALNQLTVGTRARIYSTYLDLLNSCSDLQSELIDLQQRIQLVTGPHADLDKLADQAVVAMPTVLEIDALLQTALEQRADYRRLGVGLRATELAEQNALKDERFRLRFIQPSYSRDFDSGENSWEISAAFTLPWASRNPDLSVYRQQQALQQAQMNQQRTLIEDRLSVLLNTARARQQQAALQKRLSEPAIQQLKSDLEKFSVLPLEQLQDQLSIRERILDSALLAAESDCRSELIAVDLVEELGAL